MTVRTSHAGLAGAFVGHSAATELNRANEFSSEGCMLMGIGVASLVHET